MNIHTTKTANKDGAGRIVAKGGGKQKTVPYDHSRSIAQNHGDAAGALLRNLVRPERRGFLMATAKVKDADTGKATFTITL